MQHACRISPPPPPTHPQAIPVSVSVLKPRARLATTGPFLAEAAGIGTSNSLFEFGFMAHEAALSREFAV